MADEEITESDYYDGEPCKNCGHPILKHYAQYGICDGRGQDLETGEPHCPCPGYEESEP